MKKISEGVYEDVKRSDILKIEMFDRTRLTWFFHCDQFEIIVSNHASLEYTALTNERGVRFNVMNNKFIKHMIGRTVGEAIDWIKTKSDGVK